MNGVTFTYDSLPRCARQFTGKERDSETGLDYFGARYYGSTMGRMLSPDPENFVARRNDPQSWNAYAYTRNNPLLYTDPDGLSYRVCDNEGKNCYNFENDADYNKWLKESHRFRKSRDFIGAQFKRVLPTDCFRMHAIAVE